MLVLFVQSVVLRVDFADLLLKVLEGVRSLTVGFGVDQLDSLVDIVGQLLFELKFVLTALPNRIVVLQLLLKL